MIAIRYHEAAEDELLNEIGYLKLQTKGSGRRFFAEIRRAEGFIAQFPESAEEIRPGHSEAHASEVSVFPPLLN